MSASRMPTLSPFAARPSARFTAVVDLPTPPLPDATAMIASTPGTPALARCFPAGAAWAGAGRGGAAGRGGGVGAASMPPPFFSAVNAPTAPSTPGIAFTARSAAARNGSSACARSAGTVTEKNTLELAMKMSETSPSETMSPSKSGPLIVLSVSRTASVVTDMAFASACFFVLPR